MRFGNGRSLQANNDLHPRCKRGREEEMFHAYQHDFYGDVKNRDLSRTTALEVEAKLFKSQITGNLGLSTNDIVTKNVTYNFSTSAIVKDFTKMIEMNDGKLGPFLILSNINTIVNFSNYYQSQHAVLKNTYVKNALPQYFSEALSIGAFISLHTNLKSN